MVTRELSFSTSSYVILRNQSPLYTISVLSRSKILNACLVYVSAFSSTCSRERGGRVTERPEGSPIVAVKSPMSKTAWWPSSWNWRNFSIATVWPRWMSGAVGSTPSFTRRGRPSLRRSFSSSRLITTAVPPINMSNCSSIVIDLAHRVPGAPRLFKPISCARLIERGQESPATGPDVREQARNPFRKAE